MRVYVCPVFLTDVAGPRPGAGGDFSPFRGQGDGSVSDGCCGGWEGGGGTFVPVKAGTILSPGN